MDEIAELYKTVLIDGSSVECQKLSLCCLNDYYPRFKTLKYQVDCDDYRLKFSQIYDGPQLGQAISKYLEIKRKLYK
tara:strand:+ start:40900 stop:41130 length:231 start_codon:yes stop_codon:yes gene_type:complete